MTLYDLDAPRRTATDGLLSRITSTLRTKMRRMQYAQMVNAMSRLSNEHLKSLGLERSDIPRHAHECIYGIQA